MSNIKTPRHRADLNGNSMAKEGVARLHFAIAGEPQPGNGKHRAEQDADA